MEPQEPTAAMMVGSCILPPPPEPMPPQITSTTFKAEGVRLGPQQLKEFKALTTEWDEQRTKAMADEDWHGLLDHAQHLFQASSILFRLAHLLHHLLAVHHMPLPLQDPLSKGLSSGPKEVPGGCMSVDLELWYGTSPSNPPCK